MSRASLETAIRTWLSAVSGLANTKVVPADDHGARPAKPYITYKLRSQADEGGTASQIGDGESMTFRSDKRLTVSLQAYGSGGLDLLEGIEAGLEDLDATAPLTNVGLNYSQAHAIIDLSTVLPGANKWEERAALDIEFLRFVRHVADQGAIEHVESEVLGQQVNHDL